VIDRDELISDIVDEIEKRGTFGKEPKKIEDPEILCPSCGEKLTGNEEKCPSCSVELEWVD
jgi:rubrerythrin